jgi:hypothetical protein
MTREERQALIARYKAGYVEVVTALKGIGPEELNWRPAPKEWSAREVVHHLADSETIAGIRLRRLLAEDTPQVQGYDPDEYARRLRYQDRPMEPSLQAFEAARATTAQIFDLMTDDDWQRAGTHSELGSYSVERFLEVYSGHAHEHAAQIRKNREGWTSRPR